MRRQVSDYGKAFNEVRRVLEENNMHRAELDDVGTANQTNRFLSWVRRTQAPGDLWESVAPRSQDDRRIEILRLGREWTVPENDKIPADYVSYLRQVESTFGNAGTIDNATKDELTEGLLSLHAFSEQRRFVKKEVSLPVAFWSENFEDVIKVRKTLRYLIHGGGDFVERLYDVLHSGGLQLRLFGLSCALELYGTVKPDKFPPINGRIIKGLRYLGFDVRGA